MKNNYHTHIYLCKHAIGNVEDYVIEAIKHNFDELGISDHAPLQKYLKDFSVRMSDEEFPLYLKQINECKIKYKDKLKIYSSVEIEFLPNLLDHLKEMNQNLDYLVLGQHYIIDKENKNGLKSSFSLKTIQDIQKYGELVVQAINTKSFTIVAHPDLYMLGYKNWDEHAIKVAQKIIEAAKNCKVLLEINANGVRRGKFKTPQGIRYGYPRTEFWQMVSEAKIPTIINSDCHKPDHLNDDSVKLVEKFAKDMNLIVNEKINI